MRSDAGIALVAVLGLMLVTLPLIAHVLVSVRATAVVTRATGERAQCLYTAEAGATVALAHQFAQADPSLVTNAAHNGAFPTSAYSYTVAVLRTSPERIEIASTCVGPAGIRRAVRVIVEVAGAPAEARIVSWLEVDP